MGRNKLNKSMYILIGKRNLIKDTNCVEATYHYPHNSLLDLAVRRRIKPISVHIIRRGISSSFIKRNQALHNMYLYRIIVPLGERRGLSNRSIFEIKSSFNSERGLSDLYEDYQYSRKGC